VSFCGSATDTRAPSLSVSHSANANGWNNTSPVTVHVTASDAGTGLAAGSPSCTVDGTPATVSGSAPNFTVSVTGDGSHTVRCSASDTAGNSAGPVTDTVKIDSVKPTISGSATPAANANGWNATDVAIAFTCQDNAGGSGVGTNTVAGQTLTGEGANQSVTSTGGCTDKAGNAAAAATVAGISIDKTAPAIAFTGQTPAANGAGWNATSVKLDWTCTDALSGVVAPADSHTIATEGANQAATGTCTDKAGNEATDPRGGINIDETAPGSVQTVLARAADHDGWYNHPVGWQTSGQDALSGIASCDSGTYAGPDGTGMTVKGACTDKAGNTSAPAASDAFAYDNTAPSAQTSLNRPADHNGWYNHPVGWQTSGQDAASGIASCDSGTYGGPDGTGLTVSGACTDVAGNVSVATSSGAFRYDATAPTLHPSVWPSPVLLNGAATAAANAADSLSGIDAAGTACAPVDTTSVGAHTVACTATDTAGNGASASVTYAVQYGWSGFLSPVNNPAVVNVGNAGRTYPVKWQLTDANGAYIGSAVPGTSIAYGKVSCASITADPTDALETTATGGTSLRYDTTANQYVYNWATPSAKSTCYRVTVTLPDATQHFALFSLK
jgi:hypothetical protein